MEMLDRWKSFAVVGILIASTLVFMSPSGFGDVVRTDTQATPVTWTAYWNDVNMVDNPEIPSLNEMVNINVPGAPFSVGGPGYSGLFHLGDKNALLSFELGVDSLTNADTSFTINGAGPLSVSWIGVDAMPSAKTVVIPSPGLSVGTHTITALVNISNAAQVETAYSMTFFISYNPGSPQNVLMPIYLQISSMGHPPASPDEVFRPQLKKISGGAAPSFYPEDEYAFPDANARLSLSIPTIFEGGCDMYHSNGGSEGIVVTLAMPTGFSERNGGDNTSMENWMNGQTRDIDYFLDVGPWVSPGIYNSTFTWAYYKYVEAVKTRITEHGVPYYIEVENFPLGSEKNPHLIHDVGDLQNINANLSACYALAGDIDASATAGWNEDGGVYKGFEPIGTEAAPFTGNFDGRNYTIRGLYSNWTSSRDYDFGLFGCNIGVVKNVGLLDLEIIGKTRTGGLIGWNKGKVENSYTIGNVAGHNYVGGLTGINWGESGILQRTYSISTIQGNQYIGGLAGYNSGFFSYSYSHGQVFGVNDVGGFVGTNNWNISNCYSTSSVTRSSGTSSYVGGFIGRNIWTVFNCYSSGPVFYENEEDPVDKGFIGMEDGFPSAYDNFWDTVSSGQTGNSGGGATGKTTLEMMAKSTFTDAGLDFTTDWWMVDGQTRPFLRMEWSERIYNEHQLQLMLMDQVTDYVLMQDIAMDVTNPSNMWGTTLLNGYSGFVPIGHEIDRFTGSLDGQNNTISGLYIFRPYSMNVGLIGYGDNAQVQNLILSEMNITGDDTVGGIAGCSNGMELSNLQTSGVVTCLGNNAGGVVGFHFGAIHYSTSSADVEGNTFVGGLAGYVHGEVHTSSATGNVNGVDRVGGLVGYVHYGIFDSYAWGNVTGFSNVGGLLGSGNGGAGSQVSRSYAAGRVQGSQDVGGLWGWFDGSSAATACFYDADTTTCLDTGKGEPKTTAQMKTKSTFTDAGWDFGDIWYMSEGFTYPLLRWQHQPFTINLRSTPGYQLISIPCDQAVLDAYGWTAYDLAREIESNTDLNVMYVSEYDGKWSTFIHRDSTGNLTPNLWGFNNFTISNHKGYLIALQPRPSASNFAWDLPEWMVEPSAPSDISLRRGWNAVSLIYD
ncbi:MAG: hypothetical protein QCI38_04630, partial [Candidatus Thermoplasmatota archaeon]|nr:hypothetical protein [Candidatus Thermoplasmatota archaeon]